MSGPLKHKNILLLQGPMGPFFRKLDTALRRQGANVHRICFNGGDFLFANKDNCHHFNGAPDQWQAFISRFLERHRIDMLFLYGDCRFYHRQALAVARRLNIERYVFEEGYVRPNFITLERGGVNANSGTLRRGVYRRAVHVDRPIPDEGEHEPYAFGKWALWTILYYLNMRLVAWHYPRYRHHRNDSVLLETFYGLRNGWRKIIYGIKERGIEAKLETVFHRNYYFVPLQTVGDFQISEHSSFSDMTDFIGEVMRSFARHAPPDTHLIFKHHPLDRGRVNHAAMIRRLAKRLHCQDRVLALHDVHLPTCLQNAIGTVTINSTVGISSLIHGTPTIVLGKAVYDVDGLTCKGMTLDRFWNHNRPPDAERFYQFRTRLIRQTQLVGSFYSGFPAQLINRIDELFHDTR